MTYTINSINSWSKDGSIGDIDTLLAQIAHETYDFRNNTTTNNGFTQTDIIRFQESNDDYQTRSTNIVKGIRALINDNITQFASQATITDAQTYMTALQAIIDDTTTIPEAIPSCPVSVVNWLNSLGINAPQTGIIPHNECSQADFDAVLSKLTNTI